MLTRGMTAPLTSGYCRARASPAQPAASVIAQRISVTAARSRIAQPAAALLARQAATQRPA